MMVHDFTAAFGSIGHTRLVATINVLGLALGFPCFIGAFAVSTVLRYE